MKKGLAILNGYYKLPGLLHVYERMKEEFALLGANLEMISTSESPVVYGNDGNQLPFPDADFVLFLDKDYNIAKSLENMGYRVFNGAESIRACDDKNLTILNLAGSGVAVPKTVSAPLNFSRETSPMFIEKVEREIGYPLIAKTAKGSLGTGVALLRNRLELLDFERNHKAEGRLYQEFVSSSIGTDIRLIVIGGKFLCAMKRVNTEDFRSNIAKGGEAFPFEPPASYVEMAEKAALNLKLDYCGVDILIGEKGEPLLSEVNSNAFLEGIEKATGVNVAKAYAAHILKELES